MKRIPTIGLCCRAGSGGLQRAQRRDGSRVRRGSRVAASAAVEAPDAAPSADASAPRRRRRRMRIRGLAGAFFRAAQDADLSDDQKATIAKLEEPLQGDPASHREMSALHADLVASVKEGKMDTCEDRGRTRPRSPRCSSAREEEQATALAGLHDALTPAQRGRWPTRSEPRADDRPPRRRRAPRTGPRIASIA